MKAVSKHLRSYVRWYLPLMIGSSFSAGGVLLETFVKFFDPRDYTLAAAVYLLVLASMPFHIVSFVRLWKTIVGLPPGTGAQRQTNAPEQDAGIWPPQPRR